MGVVSNLKMSKLRAADPFSRPQSHQFFFIAGEKQSPVIGYRGESFKETYRSYNRVADLALNQAAKPPNPGFTNI